VFRCFISVPVPLFYFIIIFPLFSLLSSISSREKNTEIPLSQQYPKHRSFQDTAKTPMFNNIERMSHFKTPHGSVCMNILDPLADNPAFQEPMKQPHAGPVVVSSPEPDKSNPGCGSCDSHHNGWCRAVPRWPFYNVKFIKTCPLVKGIPEPDRLRLTYAEYQRESGEPAAEEAGRMCPSAFPKLTIASGISHGSVPVFPGR
jgi:hypothetical protein